MLTANEIRTRFLQYFADNAHENVPSSSLVPGDDPSLLFTNAGMVQFKGVFLGQQKRPYTRAVTSQKCLRVGGKHNDLENVGRTARHHTFFEMLGNFSFGDYFKKEAIGLAWRFITHDLGLPEEKLFITVYKDDEEAAQLWQQAAGVPAERIYYLGEKDNFWSMGDTGPCGPCSEIHFDQGEAMSCGPECGIGSCDCDRYLEIWNLVFMQYDQAPDGTRTDLPRPSIDTGMGLERITAICQGVQSNYDTDLFTGIISYAAELAEVTFRAGSEEVDTALQVIADHSRAMAFLFADGIVPSNEGRGYVLRRLIRRACRFGHVIGLTEPFLYKTVGQVIREMGDHYQELVSSRDFMLRLIEAEEERFSRTLDKGLVLLEAELAAAREKKTTQLAGELCFTLYDTYGFPLDIVRDVAEKQGITVDEAGFDTHMQAQKQRARAAWKGSGDTGPAARFATLPEEGLHSEFTGYTSLTEESRLIAVLDEQAHSIPTLASGQTGFIVTTKTPFYGESGGQAGDTGTITTPTGAMTVHTTLKPAPTLTVHRVTVEQGEIVLDQPANLTVDFAIRAATAANHTLTHLLHAALREVLGDHVKQAGSLLGPDRLRFDFQHIAAMTAAEIARVEEFVHQAIIQDSAVNTMQMSYDDALATGAVALFGEKYTQQVRVVEIPGVSMELCGGTHAGRTGQTGPFFVLSETGIAAGVRRIEAVTGTQAIQFAQQQRALVTQIAQAVKSKPAQTPERVTALQQEIRQLKKDRERMAAQTTATKGTDLMEGLEQAGNVAVLTALTTAPTIGALRQQMDAVRARMPEGIAALACEVEGKAQLLVYVSSGLHDSFTAPELVKAMAQHIQGSGGGRADMAQAGGSRPEGIQAAFTHLKELVQQ